MKTKRCIIAKTLSGRAVCDRIKELSRMYEIENLYIFCDGSIYVNTFEASEETMENIIYILVTQNHSFTLAKKY